MKISEMSLEELQDYAIKLEQEKKILEDNKNSLEETNKDLMKTNEQLQIRNNKLFLQVESGVNPQQADEPPKPETCEEFATTNKDLGGYK